MRIPPHLPWLCLACAVLSCRAEEPPGLSAYTGMCDASAAAAVDPNSFVVADDEGNTLRVYSRDQGGPPLLEVNLSGFLGVTKESDLEGAAPWGDRIYWISSHGTNKKGRPQPGRQRLFATTVEIKAGRPALIPVGRPYTSLLEDLAAHPELAQFNLGVVRAPKEEGALNIEGLCTTPEGHLLVGFRNPIPRGRALIVPLLNPAEVVQGNRARLGAPVLLDLGGLGVRSIDRMGRDYLILAGSFASDGDFALFRWDGSNNPPRRLDTTDLEGMNPEALIHFPGSRKLLVLSDDGAEKNNGVECKKLKDPRLRSFRALVLSAPSDMDDLLTQVKLPQL